MTQHISEAISKPVRASARKGRVKLSPTVSAIARTLMNRDYRSSELAFELKLAKGEYWRVREWCRRGLPHGYDDTGHLLINGLAFRDWVIGQSRQGRPHRPLAPGQMYCFACGAPQTPVRSEIVDAGHRMMKRGICPHGHPMTQWISRRRAQ